jgi:hypothetical protein
VIKTSNQLPVKVNYFLAAVVSFGAAVVSFGAAAVVSFGAAVVSFGATAVVSFGASVVAVSLLLQAVNTEATAIAKNTFFICFCLIFKNYNFIFIPKLKKGNPPERIIFVKYFFVVLGYKSSITVLILTG